MTVLQSTYSQLKTVNSFVSQVVYCQIMPLNVSVSEVLSAVVVVICCGVPNYPQIQQFRTNIISQFLWVKNPDVADLVSQLGFSLHKAAVVYVGTTFILRLHLGRVGSQTPSRGFRLASRLSYLLPAASVPCHRDLFIGQFTTWQLRSLRASKMEGRVFQ